MPSPNRRTVSVTARLYARLQARRAFDGRSIAQTVEAALAAAEPWTADGVPKIDPATGRSR